MSCDVLYEQHLLAADRAAAVLLWHPLFCQQQVQEPFVSMVALVHELGHPGSR
jgi:hypothetical protein